MSELSILLIHPNNNCQNDTITIKPIMDRFRINYNSTYYGINHFMYCTDAETFRYVDDLMYLMPSDIYTYTNVQFNFPCFPPLFYRICDFDNQIVRRTIRDRLVSILLNWPEARAV
jgi:hypothetical protein